MKLLEHRVLGLALRISMRGKDPVSDLFMFCYSNRLLLLLR